MTRLYAWLFLIIIPICLIITKRSITKDLWEQLFYPSLLWISLACNLWVTYRREKFYGILRTNQQAPEIRIGKAIWLITRAQWWFIQTRPLSALLSYAPALLVNTAAFGGFPTRARMIITGIALVIAFIYIHIQYRNALRLPPPRSPFDENDLNSNNKTT